MPKPRRLKYKIYRQLRSDITGEVLFKYKINKVTVFILKHFEYKLNQFRSDFKRWISIFSLKAKEDIETRLPLLYKNKVSILGNFSIRQKYNTGIAVLFRQAHLVRKKLMKVWRIKQKKKKIIKWHLKKKTFDKDILLNQHFDSGNENSWLSESQRQGSSKNITPSEEKLKNIDNSVKTSSEGEKNISKNSFFRRRKKLRGNNFRGLVLERGEKRIKKNWLIIQLTEKKYAHYYGFKSIPRFKLLQDTAFYCNKLRLNAIFKLEGMLSVVAFRLNLAPTVYQCRNIVRSGILLVNNLRILNPTFRINLFDDISINGQEEYDFMIDVMHRRLLSRKFYLNVPDYIEINYRIFHASFWRYPHKSEIVGPYNFPYFKSPHDWSTSTKTIRR